MHFFVRARVKHKRLALASGVSLATATPRSLVFEVTATPKRAKLKVKYDHNKYIKFVLNMNYVHFNLLYLASHLVALLITSGPSPITYT